MQIFLVFQLFCSIFFPAGELRSVFVNSHMGVNYLYIINFACNLFGVKIKVMEGGAIRMKEYMRKVDYLLDKLKQKIKMLKQKRKMGKTGKVVKRR